VLCTAGIAVGQLQGPIPLPGALSPLSVPAFSLDSISPTLNPPFSTSADILAQDAIPQFGGINIGFQDVLDDLDGLSFTNAGLTGNNRFLLTFSVGRGLKGALPPDEILSGLDHPIAFSAQTQSLVGQASASAFTSTRVFDQTGGLFAAATADRVSLSSNNFLSIAERDCGGPDFLTVGGPPGYTCETFQPGIGDLVDAIAGVGASTRGPDAIYYSGSSTSPSLGLISAAAGDPSAASGATIFRDAAPSTPGGETIYARFDDIHLTAGDDIDALIVIDGADPTTFDPAVDRVIFSVASGSPSLGSLLSPDDSAADLFTLDASGDLELYSSALELGLDPITDELDALDFTLIPPSMRDAAEGPFLASAQDAFEYILRIGVRSPEPSTFMSALLLTTAIAGRRGKRRSIDHSDTI
jgi:hypothetical protein